MIPSESGNTELLNAATILDGSVPCTTIKHFEAHNNIGGGIVVVNHYGDYTLTATRIDIGIMGNDWTDIDHNAVLYLRRVANMISAKCIAAGLTEVLGGAAALLYFSSPETVTDENRKHLWTAFFDTLQTLTKTNILCLPANLTEQDLHHMYNANEALKVATTAEVLNDDEEKKADADREMVVPVKESEHKRSFAVESESFEYPLPKSIISEGNSKLRVIIQCAAHSSFGSIVTLIKAKHWSYGRILMLGITPLSFEVYHLLTRETETVVMMSDLNSTKHYESSGIPPRSIISWDKAFDTCNHWDIVVFCSSRDCPILDPTVISNIQCKAVIALSDDVLPLEQDQRYLSFLQLQKKGIFEMANGLSDLGEIAKMYSLYTKGSTFTFHDAYELGCQVMQQKLNCHETIPNDDVIANYDHIWHAMQKDQNNMRLFNLGMVIHQSLDCMNDRLWDLARHMCPAFCALSLQSTTSYQPEQVRYLNIGAWNLSTARWICKQNKKIHITYVDIDPKQQSAENRNLLDEKGLCGQIDMQRGSFEGLISEYNNFFDGCILSQDAFSHTLTNLDEFFSKAYRVTKGGGWLLILDLMRGDAEERNEEMEFFLEGHKIADWGTPSQCVERAEQVGWTEVKFIDCTAEIKVSLQDLMEKINAIIELEMMSDGKNLQLLKTYRLHLSNRIEQSNRGVFKWGIISGRKPYNAVFMSEPPVAPEARDMIRYSVSELSGDLKFGTDVLVVNMKEQLTRKTIMKLPSTTRLIVSLSAGLDHICVEAAVERGIQIRRAARETIVKSVADYLFCNIMVGLRCGFQNVGATFPGAFWSAMGSVQGLDLDCSRIGFIGIDDIAVETAKKLRALSKTCHLIYHVPAGVRCRFEEGAHQMHHVGIADLLSTCDVVVCLVRLTKTTSGLINYSSFSLMKHSAIFIHLASGNVVETTGMLRALNEGLLYHVIFHETDSEPLPPDHELCKLQNCTITSHFASNTTFYSKEMVEDVPNQVEDALEERGMLRQEEQRMRVELSEAYRITREFGMDELVWNHISVLLSDGSFLITPGSRMFDDIGPEDLVKSSGNITADIIHEAIYKARSDVKAIVHLHTPATVAVSCLEMGFVPLAQEAAPFVGRVSRHPWHGVSNDREEQASIGDSIKDEKINTMLMDNHGFCTFGRTLGEAWVLAYYFDKACQTQLNCLQTGQKINFPNEKVLAHAAEQSQLPEFLPGACEWDALRKMLTRPSRLRL